MIKVSVIVPIYNVAEYLPKCLDSLCNQTLQEIEIIGIDDCSPDNSGSILDIFAQKDSRIVAIHNKTNQKTANSRNIGLKNARGEYVAFVDGDDYIDLDFLEKLYNNAIKHKADISKGLSKNISKKKITVVNDNKEIEEKGKYHFYGRLWTAIYKKDFLKKNNIKFCIDFFCFQIQAVYYANRIVCVDDTFYNYIIHDNSCDSKVFSIEKWIRLNIGHADFMHNWVMTHEYTDDIRRLYMSRVNDLYFYGFNKLSRTDILEGCKILSDKIVRNNKYSFDFKKQLVRELFKKHKKTNIFQYWFYRLKGKI